METPLGKDFKLFQKSGGFVQAQKDFYSINPSNVHVDEVVKGLQVCTCLSIALIRVCTVCIQDFCQNLI